MKQSRFYMLSLHEEQAFINYLQDGCNVKIVIDRTPSPDLIIVDTVPPIGPWRHDLYIWDADHSPPPVVEFIATPKHYLVDDVKSELMEFGRCSIREEEDGKRWVNQGRIAINHKTWVDGVLVEKPKHFIAFFEKARKWIKKNAVYRTETGSYVFPSVAKFLDEGGTFGAY